jgi:nucleotide-binding universal stress UspA family protein
VPVLNPSKPIVWGIDPNQLNSHDLRRMKKILSILLEAFQSQVLPVSVLAPMEIFGSLEINGPIRSEWASTTLKRINLALRELDLEDLEEPRILTKEGYSLSSSVRQLIDFSIEESAALIVVCTRAQSGFQRWGLGSFADALIASSPVPILTLNPKTEVPKRVSRILFATDFSKESQRTFQTVMTWAEKLRAEIVLFHKMGDPNPTAYYSDYGISIDAESQAEINRAAEEACERHVRNWHLIAHKRDLKCDVVIWRAGGSLQAGICSTAIDVKADLIAVSTHRGPMGQRFLGSTARDILASASCPVVITHEK